MQVAGIHPNFFQATARSPFGADDLAEMRLRLSFGLGSIKCAVSTLHQPVQIQTMFRSKRKANTDGDAHLRAIDLIDVGELANDARGKEFRLVLRLDARLKHGEFFPAEPADPMAASHRSSKTLCDLDQDNVADWMSELIIESFEPVQIEIMEGNFLIGATRYRSGQKRPAYQKSVRKTGKWSYRASFPTPYLVVRCSTVDR